MIRYQYVPSWMAWEIIVHFLSVRDKFVSRIALARKAHYQKLRTLRKSRRDVSVMRPWQVPMYCVYHKTWVLNNLLSSITCPPNCLALLSWVLACESSLRKILPQKVSRVTTNRHNRQFLAKAALIAAFPKSWINARSHVIYQGIYIGNS